MEGEGNLLRPKEAENKTYEIKLARRISADLSTVILWPQHAERQHPGVPLCAIAVQVRDIRQVPVLFNRYKLGEICSTPGELVRDL